MFDFHRGQAYFSSLPGVDISRIVTAIFPLVSIFLQSSYPLELVSRAFVRAVARAGQPEEGD